MSDWRPLYEQRRTTAEDAVARIRSGDRVLLSSAGAEPQALVAALVARHASLENVTLYTQIPQSDCAYAKPEMAGHFRPVGLVLSRGLIDAVQRGAGDYLPCHVSQMAYLFTSGALPLDAALVQAAPPDADGYCSLGIAVDYCHPVLAHVPQIIAEVNAQMPALPGDNRVHVSQFAAIVESDRPLLELPPAPIGPTEAAIGELIAELVPDGATVETGIGALPDAALAALRDKRDLGIHSGVIGDGAIALIESGAVTGARKERDRGLIVVCGLLGTNQLYQWAARRADIRVMPTTYTHNPAVLAEFASFIGINSALQVDLTGQINAEAVGTRQISGIGGQLDFTRAGMLGGARRAIVALNATATVGGQTISRIVPTLPGATPVTVPRHDAHTIVTEHGVADLRGKTLRERARALIAVADPSFRPELERWVVEH